MTISLRTPAVLAAAAALAGSMAVRAAAQQVPMASPAPAGHLMVEAAKVVWGPAPAALPAGAKSAVLKGDPAREEAFVIRVWVPAGYKVAPHWHPTTEHLTVLTGTVAMGLGDTFDKSKLMTVGAGGLAVMPGMTNHFFWAETEATFQVHGMGPFALVYLNPADDPRNQAAKK